MSDEDLRRGVRAILSGAAVGLDSETINDLIEALHKVTGDRFHAEHVTACKSVLGKEPFWFEKREGWCMHLALEVGHSTGSQMCKMLTACSKSVFESGHYLVEELKRGPRTGRATCKRCAARAKYLRISRGLVA